MDWTEAVARVVVIVLAQAAVSYWVAVFTHRKMQRERQNRNW
jgi:hypothetical protein